MGTSEASPPASEGCMTVADAVDIATELHAGRDAYIDGPDRMIFAQLVARSASLASQLYARGVGAGDVVALMLDSGIDYAIAYLAVLRLGAVVTGLNPRLGWHETDAIIARCAPVLVIRDDQLGMPDVAAGIAVMERAELAAAAHAGEPLPDGQPPASLRGSAASKKLCRGHLKCASRFRSHSNSSPAKASVESTGSTVSTTAATR